MSRLPGHGPELLLDRRRVLSGACLLVAAAGVSGCSDRDEPPSAPAPGTELGVTTDIPVGGGTVLPEHRIVVTQPVQGAFSAFSSVCTHQGCTVDQVTQGVITCPCHGSRFDVADGAVIDGPADAPLPQVAIAVDGTRIRLA